MNEQQWNFRITDSEIQFRMEKNGSVCAEAVFADCTLSVSLLYSSFERPLILRAAADVGDDISLVLRPYRIELWVKGVICDEEWPWGELICLDSRKTVSNTEITVSPAPKEENKPSFCGSFTDAEGWFPGGGVFVGDCMPYTCDDRYHVLYLKDRHHHRSKWDRGAHQWEHLSTTDLLHWDIHPMAVEIDDPDEGSICTGSWITESGKYYLYYTVRTMDGSPAPIRRSVSEDGYHFAKDRSFSFTLSERYLGNSARDPKVVRGEDGLLHMFLTTTDLEAHRGCLCHLISADGENFRERGNIYTAEQESFGEPECSDYFRLGRYYYLIFSHGGRGQYRYSEKPFTDWKLPEDPYIPCDSVPKCAVWNGRIIFTGFHGMGGYAGSLTFTEALQREDGTLSFEKLFK